MENLPDELNNLIAKRLVARAHAPEDQKPIGERQLSAAPPTSQALSRVEFVKVEKNLASLGFFTPSSKRVRVEKVKTIGFTKTIDGKRVEARATIAPAAIYGLPITADQDKYLAMQKLVTDTQRRKGRVENPIAFSSAEILRLLNRHRDSGKNYRDIEEWLNVMTATTIVSEGAVYFAGQKRWVKDRFHVFDRAVSVGKEFPDGTIADRNYVWLSDWQLENINNNHQLPIDLEAYRQLKNHIAKALVPLLQIWLYASREDGLYAKRYHELCEILNLRCYPQPSRIKEQFGPSLDELQAHGYLATWSVEETSDRKNYKIVFRHGEKFHRDRRRRLAAGESESGQPQRSVDEPIDAGEERDELVEELTGRGVSERQARQVLSAVTGDQPILEQLEWGDAQIEQSPGKIRNPAGFYLSLIRDNVAVPTNFETSRKRREREERHRAQAAERERVSRLKMAYEDYQHAEIEKYLAALPPAEYEELIQQKTAELSKEYPSMAGRLAGDHLAKMARVSLASDVIQRLSLVSFSEFCKTHDDDNNSNT